MPDHWEPDDPYVGAKLLDLMSLWEEAKGWGFAPNRNFVKRFWRVLDHHEWAHVAEVAVEYLERAHTPLYLLKVLETPERYTQIEIRAEVERCREDMQARNTNTFDEDRSRLNPFLSGSIERRRTEPSRLGDVGFSLPSAGEGKTT